MSYEENMVLEFTQYLKSVKAPSFIYADLEPFIKKRRGCKNNEEKLPIIKKSEHTPWGYTISIYTVT